MGFEFRNSVMSRLRRICDKALRFSLHACNVRDVSDGNGPDQVLPAVQSWTSEANGLVKLRLDKAKGIAIRPPVSIPGLLHRTAAKYPKAIALSYKDLANGNWNNITYKQYEENVRTVAKAFLKLGLERHHGVGILGFNSPEWFYSYLGAIYAGGIAVGIYTTNGPEACQHCLDLSDANICVVEDEKQLQKIYGLRNSLPKLKAIVQYSGTPTKPGVLSWSELMEIGKKEDNSGLEAVLKKIAINKCCSIVFTSGTVGMPKAAMLSHDNLVWSAYAISKSYKFEYTKEKIVSYLPLSHIAGQLVDILLSITTASKICFADKNAMKGSLLTTLTEVRPTAFLGVPRVWEKIYEKMAAVDSNTTGIKKKILTWGKATSLSHYNKVMQGRFSFSILHKLFRLLVFKKVKAAIGLDKCKIQVSAAAPISLDVKKFFLSMDIPVTEVYGMSECTGSHALSTPIDFELDAVGRTIKGAETRDNHTPDGHPGEIFVRGRHVFMGYLKEPQKTKSTLDSEGWLHTGDLGIVDKRGHLRITGRIKELLITAGGENVAPLIIEEMVKKELPVVSNAQVIGDKRKFLSILLTLKTKVDPATGAPLDELTSEAKAWCKGLGREVNTVTEVLQQPNKKIMDAIQAGIDRANNKAISQAQRVQKFAILPADFSIATGELGPTLKLKRSFVYEKYANLIENLYKE